MASFRSPNLALYRITSLQWLFRGTPSRLPVFAIVFFQALPRFMTNLVAAPTSIRLIAECINTLAPATLVFNSACCPHHSWKQPSHLNFSKFFNGSPFMIDIMPIDWEVFFFPGLGYLCIELLHQYFRYKTNTSLWFSLEFFRLSAIVTGFCL